MARGQGGRVAGWQDGRRAGGQEGRLRLRPVGLPPLMKKAASNTWGHIPHGGGACEAALGITARATRRGEGADAVQRGSSEGRGQAEARRRGGGRRGGQQTAPAQPLGPGQRGAAPDVGGAHAEGGERGRQLRVLPERGGERRTAARAAVAAREVEGPQAVGQRGDEVGHGEEPAVPELVVRDVELIAQCITWCITWCNTQCITQCIAQCIT